MLRFSRYVSKNITALTKYCYHKFIYSDPSNREHESTASNKYNSFKIDK